jgi:hypothetical protein
LVNGESGVGSWRAVDVFHCLVIKYAQFCDVRCDSPMCAAKWEGCLTDGLPQTKKTPNGIFRVVPQARSVGASEVSVQREE